jgi:hypothetical protein
MIPDIEILARLYHNRELLSEAERDRLFRMSPDWQPSFTLIRRGLILVGKVLIWVGNWLEALSDGYYLDKADQSC